MSSFAAHAQALPSHVMTWFSEQPSVTPCAGSSESSVPVSTRPLPAVYVVSSSPSQSHMTVAHFATWSAAQFCGSRNDWPSSKSEPVSCIPTPAA